MENTPDAGAGTSHLRAIGKLTWEQDGEKKTQPIASDGLTIGRSSQNNLIVKDLGASRFHCKILPDAGQLLLVDLESSNGTYLNNVRIQESQALQNGDKIKIGDTIYTTEIFEVKPTNETLAKGNETLSLEETYIVPDETSLPWLMVSSGMGKGTIYSLTKNQMQIGRASRNQQWDIDLIDRSVSRPHAELVQKDNNWVLTDLNSANGTTVNGEAIKEPRILNDSDIVGFGETILIFRMGKEHK
jgi:pSer/pThr/pTyr-binding forkhead associated (FHA) protein